MITLVPGLGLSARERFWSFTSRDVPESDVTTYFKTSPAYIRSLTTPRQRFRSLSFAKSASESPGDHSCPCDRPDLQRDRWAVVGKPGPSAPSGHRPAKGRGGSPCGMDGSRTEGS